MGNRLAGIVILLELILIGLLLASAYEWFPRDQSPTAREFLVGWGVVKTGLPEPTPGPARLRAIGIGAVGSVRQETPALTKFPSVVPSSTATPVPSVTLAPTEVPWTMVTRCGTLTQPGTYVLDRDLAANGDCLTIRTGDAVLDCAGHSIRGTNRSGYGIVIRKYGLLGEQVPADVEIRNCTLSRFFYGIYVESGNRLVIRNNNSSENYDDVQAGNRYGDFLGMAEGGGIRLNYSADSQILNNITNHQAIGIDIHLSSGVTVRGNTASSNSAWGINLLRTQNSQVVENTTADNIRQCTWGAGVVGPGCDAGGIILQDGSSNNLIARNHITGQNGNGIFIKAHALPCGSNNSIVGNTIVSALYNSVELGFCVGNKVNGNIMRDGLDGVMLVFAHDVEIKDNTITDMRNHGILSPNSHHITVSGNEITNSNEGMYFYSESYDHDFFSWLPPGDYASHDNCLCGNTLRSNRTGVHLRDSSYNRVVQNKFEENRLKIVIEGRTEGNETTNNLGWHFFLPDNRAFNRTAARLFVGALVLAFAFH